MSISERDRRYALLREAMKERGIDCAVVGTSNLAYITNGIPGERQGLLPTEPLPPTVTLHYRNLVDLPPEALREIHHWVEDLRAGNDASALIERIRELRLENGVIGLGIANAPVGYGGLGHGLCTELQSAFPSAHFVDVSDLFVNVRIIKSDEEVAMIERANRIFDTAIQAVCEVVRPGMLGARVVHEGTRAMWEAGGDLSSTLLVSCGPVPKRNHMLQDLTLGRVIERSDVAIVTGLARYGGYAGHSDQEICFGPPRALHREMFEAVLFVRDAILREVRPGATQGHLVEAYRSAYRETGFRPSSQSQWHQYGIDVPEYPWPPLAPQGEKVDFVLQSGMVYSIAPALVAANADDVMIAGSSLVVTDSGYRSLGDEPVELLSIDD